MKSFTLDNLDRVDFFVLAINSHAKGHKICWEINQRLKLNFIKNNFVLKRKCFCSAAFAGPFEVSINKREVKDIKHLKIDVSTSKKRINSIGAKNRFSVITHFGSYNLDGIIREVKSFIRLDKPHSIEIKYNETYGYPNKIQFEL